MDRQLITWLVILHVCFFQSQTWEDDDRDGDEVDDGDDGDDCDDDDDVVLVCVGFDFSFGCGC